MENWNVDDETGDSFTLVAFGIVVARWIQLRARQRRYLSRKKPGSPVKTGKPADSIREAIRTIQVHWRKPTPSW